MANLLYNEQPTTDWTISDWVSWHKGLVDYWKDQKATNGIKFADAAWITQWQKVAMNYVLYPNKALRDLMDINTNKSDHDYIRLNPFLYKYSGLEYIERNPGYNPFASDIYKAELNVATGVESVVSGVGSTAKVLGDILKYGLPILAVLIIVGGGFWAYKKYKSSVNTSKL